MSRIPTVQGLYCPGFVRPAFVLSRVCTSRFVLVLIIVDLLKGRPEPRMLPPAKKLALSKEDQDTKEAFALFHCGVRQAATILWDIRMSTRIST